MASETTQASVPSQKRPLEDPSSENDVNDQPDAKRPALDNVARENGVGKDEADTTAGTNGDAAEIPAKAKTDSNGEATTSAIPTAAEVLETQPIQSTASASGAASDATFQDKHQDETGWLHIRSIISSTEAATVIGKGGENVTLIRRLSGAKCTVSDYSRGAVERILTVSGLVDAVAKAFGLIIRTLNNEDLETSSTAQSKTYPLRLLIPHILIGSIIGQKGVRIREIQEASGARLNASDSCLPLSTERSLVVLGVADAVHIATYYVGSTLHEQLTERFGGPAASAYATRSGGPAGVVPGGMQVVPYTPQPVHGQWGPPDRYNRTHPPAPRPAPNAYGLPYAHAPHMHAQPPMPYAQSPRVGYQAAAPQVQPAYGQQPMVPQQAGQPPQAMQGGAALPGQPLTQQIFIPNDMVGAIIGKGGAKINEIRQLSGSVIKINEPQDNNNERLVTITGTPECNQMALYMLYQRLGESSSPKLPID